MCAKDRGDVYRQNLSFGQQVLGFLAQILGFFEGMGMHQSHSFQRHLFFEQTAPVFSAQPRESSFAVYQGLCLPPAPTLPGLSLPRLLSLPLASPYA